MCKHQTCINITNQGGKGGVAVACLNYYKKNGVNKRVIVLGKEKGGTYAGKYNVCSGKFNQGETCFLETLARELYEEFKYTTMKFDTNSNKLVVNWTDFDKILKWNNNSYWWFIHHNTPVFVANFSGFSCTEANKIIDKHNNNRNLNGCYKELEELDWFNISDGKNMKGNYKKNISSFAEAILKAIRNQKFYFLN